MQRTAFLASTLALAAGLSAFAHNEPFAYLRGAQTEPKGEWEIEQWVTARLGKQEGSYTAIDISTELEYGITDRLQAALYVNTLYQNIDGARGGTKTFDDLEHFEYDGLSGELKYQLSDPYRTPWGFALYFEPGYGRFSTNDGEREDRVFLEFKGIAEKHFFDHRLIAAFNYTLEPEWEREPGGSWETELEMEWALGLSWQLTPRWRAGVEGTVRTVFPEAELDHAEFTTVYLGPTVAYSAERWFAILSAQPQITGWPDASGSAGRHFDHGEALEIRMKFGFEF